MALIIRSADASDSSRFNSAWCIITSLGCKCDTVISVTTEGAGDGGLDILYTHVFIRIALRDFKIAGFGREHREDIIANARGLKGGLNITGKGF